MPDSLSVPPFQSKLPDWLLTEADLTKKEKHLFAKLDEIGQAQTWLVGQAVKQHEQLVEVKEELGLVKAQTLKTNGRTTAIEAELVATKPDIETVRLAKRVVRSKPFWIAAAAFLLVGVPFIAAHAPGAAGFYGFLTSLIGL